MEYGSAGDKWPIIWVVGKTLSTLCKNVVGVIHSDPDWWSVGGL